MGIIILSGILTIIFFICFIIGVETLCDEWVEYLFGTLTVISFIVFFCFGLCSLLTVGDEHEVQNQKQIDRAVLIHELENIDEDTSFEVAVDIYENVAEFNTYLEKHNSNYDNSWYGKCYYDLTMIKPIELEQYWDEYNKLEIEEEEGEKE